MGVAPPLPLCSYLRLACSSLGAQAPRGLGPLYDASSTGAGRFDMATLLLHGDPPCLPDGSTAVTAALAGVLSSDEVAVQRREIQKLLTQGHAVILDVADLRIRHGSAVKVFSNALLAAGGWPSVRLVVVGPDGQLAAALDKTGVSQDVHVVDDIQCAIAKLQARPRRVSRRAWLRPNSIARRQSRTMIYTICHEWCIPHLIRSARTVTAELVHNAIELARTPSVFKVSLDDAGLRIALRDFRATQGFRLRPDSSVPPSLGRVVRFADSCGVTPLSDGKIVWAVLTTNGGAR